MTLIGRILGWLQGHPLAAIVIACGAVASAMKQIAEIVSGGLAWYRRRTTGHFDRYIPGHDDWIHVTNIRFGFTFAYPRAWLRETSGSTDGHTVRHPLTEDIEIRGWGGHAVVWDTLDSWICMSTKNTGGHFVSRTEVDVPIEMSGMSHTDGFRLVYDDGNVRQMQVFVQVEARQVSILCSAPKKDFPRYEPTFLTACNSLALTQSVDTAPK